MLFSFVSVVLLASAQARFYTDCGSDKLATVESVGVSGCAESAKECVLRRNTNATISIVFTPSVDVAKLETVVHGIIMSLPVPFPLPQPDACQESGLSCPLKAGAKASYATTLPVLKSYPKVRVDVKWELKNDKDGSIVCVLIPAKIN